MRKPILACTVIAVLYCPGCAKGTQPEADGGSSDAPYDTYFPPLGDSGGSNLTCTGFGFSPNPPLSGTDVTVTYQHTIPFSNVALIITGPGTGTPEWIGVTGGNGEPYTWSWKVTFSAAGSWQVKFTADQLDDESDRPICNLQVTAGS